MKTITLEEHFTTKDFVKAVAGKIPENPAMRETQARLLDLGAGRLAAMDAGGVDVQVLSVAALGMDKLPAEDATALMQGANDELAEAVRANPTRLAGFANVNLLEPEKAAREMERCIRKLEFRGVLVNGHTGGAFLDDPRFLPVWEAASALKVPVYLHPAPPPAQVFDVYYAGLPGASGMALSIAGWGWHVELGLHVLRLMLGGVFDRFPEQQVVIGHMGENLPFSLARAAGVLGGTAKHLKRGISEYFHQNIHVTTSGYFTQPPFRCALEVVGIDRLLYSVDYPFSLCETGRKFLDEVELPEEEFAKLVGGNAERLLGV